MKNFTFFVSREKSVFFSLTGNKHTQIHRTLQCWNNPGLQTHYYQHWQCVQLHHRWMSMSFYHIRCVKPFIRSVCVCVCDLLFFSHSGFFTAPVKGVYDFSFYVYGHSRSTHMGAHLRRNGLNLVMAYTELDRGAINASNGASVLLEVGDVVDVFLPANHRIYDNANHHSTFRGHLLFHV